MCKSVTTLCWISMGGVYSNGYGRFFIDGKERLAHRASYEAFVGPIPSGASIDHLCRNKLCINPRHLEPIAQAENISRGVWSNGLKRSDFCRNGHKYEDGSYRINKAGFRICVECKNRGWRDSYYRNRESRLRKIREKNTKSRHGTKTQDTPPRQEAGAKVT